MFPNVTRFHRLVEFISYVCSGSQQILWTKDTGYRNYLSENILFAVNIPYTHGVDPFCQSSVDIKILRAALPSI
jgi:hypothetical protein